MLATLRPWRLASSQLLDVLEGVFEDFHVTHVAKEGFSDVGHPEALEAGLQPAVMISLRVSAMIPRHP